MGKRQTTRYFASIGFTYGKKANGKDDDVLDRGQILQGGMKGLPNDANLRGRGYIRILEPDIEPKRCGACGALFRTDSDLSMHGQSRHPDWRADEEVEHEAALEAMRVEDQRRASESPIRIGKIEGEGLSAETEAAIAAQSDAVVVQSVDST